MKEVNSGISELQMLMERDGNLSFEKKLKLCMFGCYYENEDLLREWRGEELLKLWNNCDVEGLEKLVRLAKTRQRMNEAGKRANAVMWKDDGSYLHDNNALRHSSKINSILFGEAPTLLLPKGFIVGILQTWGNHALHPIYFGVLCYSRKPRSAEPVEIDFKHEEWIKTDKWIGAFESLTEPVSLTTQETYNRLLACGVIENLMERNPDLRSISTAANILGIPLASPKRGFKPRPPSDAPTVRKKATPMKKSRKQRKN